MTFTFSPTRTELTSLLITTALAITIVSSHSTIQNGALAIAALAGLAYVSFELLD